MVGEFSVFSVTQKRRRDTILTNFGFTLRLTLGSFLMKKHVFLQTCFFLNFVMFLGGGRRRRSGPSSLKTLKNSTLIPSRPAPLKGCGEYLQASPLPPTYFFNLFMILLSIVNVTQLDMFL